MDAEKNRAIELEKSRAQIVEGVKMMTRGQFDLMSIEIELSDDFRQIVTAPQNPAVKRARNCGIAYTVAKNSDIVEVNGHTRSVIGRVAKSDVKLSKGMTYKLTK